MSSMIGDRSGNRGKCAQPCRLPYELIKEETNGKTSSCGKGYLLSPKDLSTLEILKDLPNVSCLKIEGRMKSPEYVATVVSLYRKYIDSLPATPTSKDKENLAQIFNRGGFSNAYLYSKTGKDVMCYEKPKNWGLFVGKVISYDERNSVTVSADSNIDLKVGDGIEIWNGSNESPSCIISNLTKTNGKYKIERIHGEIHKGDKVYRTLSKELNQQAKESYSRGFRVHKKVDVSLEIKKNSNIKIVIDDFKYDTTIVPDEAQKAPLTKEKLEEQLRKTGNTPFEINNLDILLEDNLFLPVSKINEIRRLSFEAYENHLNQISKKEPLKRDLLSYTTYSKKSTNKKEVSCLFNYLSDDILELQGIDNYYINFKDAIKNEKLIKKISGKKYIVFPNVTKGNYEKLIKEKVEEISNIVDGFIISNIGQLEFLMATTGRRYNAHSGNPIELIANYTLNTFNSYTVDLLASLGFSKVILSAELTKNQINDICKKLPANIKTEIIAYGSICVMTSEYCPVGSVEGGFCKDKTCSKPCTKNAKYYLKDRMNALFRVIPDNIDCQSRIYNSKINSIETKELYIDSIRLDFIDEDIDEMQKLIDIHKDGNKISCDRYTNGHLNRPV